MEADEKRVEPGIRVVASDEVSVVKKPWGWERWLADGRGGVPYALKIIHVRAPHQTSLQFHRFKQESTYILEGSALLHYVEEAIDAERYASGGYSDEELRSLLGGLKIRTLRQGDTIHVRPGHIHRVEARDEDVTYVEASTTELDDVFRLQDDASRGHGRISSEHA